MIYRSFELLAKLTLKYGTAELQHLQLHRMIHDPAKAYFRIQFGVEGHLSTASMKNCRWIERYNLPVKRPELAMKALELARIGNLEGVFIDVWDPNLYYFDVMTSHEPLFFGVFNLSNVLPGFEDRSQLFLFHKWNLPNDEH